MSTFVTVGSSNRPFARLLEAVFAAIDCLPKPVRIQHGSTPCAVSDQAVELHGFLPRALFDRYLRESELLICHGGATVLEAIAAGHQPLVLARDPSKGEVIDDHQIEYVRALEAAGMCVTFSDGAGLRNTIGRVRPRIASPPAGSCALIEQIRRDLAEAAGSR